MLSGPHHHSAVFRPVKFPLGLVVGGVLPRRETNLLPCLDGRFLLLRAVQKYLPPKRPIKYNHPRNTYQPAAD